MVNGQSVKKLCTYFPNCCCLRILGTFILPSTRKISLLAFARTFFLRILILWQLCNCKPCIEKTLCYFWSHLTKTNGGAPEQIFRAIFAPSLSSPNTVHFYTSIYRKDFSACVCQDVFSHDSYFVTIVQLHALVAAPQGETCSQTWMVGVQKGGKNKHLRLTHDPFNWLKMSLVSKIYNSLGSLG